MRFMYYILKDGKWTETDYETYRAFEGEKQVRPSTWKLLMISQMLLPYRYSK